MRIRITSQEATVLISDISQVLKRGDEQAQNLKACLVVIGGELNGTVFDLRELTLIGRQDDCDIILEYQGISREHVRIEFKDNHYLLHDLGSKNGTYIHTDHFETESAPSSAAQIKKIETSSPHTLVKGDHIKLGAITLKYLPQGDIERLTYEKLRLEAFTDGLTKCYNKTYFNQQIEVEVKKAKATGKPLSLIIFDLDHFKKLNDNYGHDAGDYVLKELGELLRKNGARDGDVIARYGGEEFVVLLPLTNIKVAYDIAERMRALIENHQFIYEAQRLPVTASIGLADYRPGVADATELFKRADQSVYQSKHKGRNQVSFYRDEKA